MSAVVRSILGRIVLLLLLVFVPAAIMMALTYLQEREFLSDQAEGTLRRIARMIVMTQTTVTVGAQTLTTELAKRGYVLPRDDNACRQQVKALVREKPIFLNIGYVDARGRRECSAIPAVDNPNFADRDWFRKARDRRKFVVGEYVDSRIDGARSIVYAYPIFGAEGGFRGVTYAVTNLSWLVDMVLAADLPPTSSAMVVDVQGNVLARHPDAEGLSGKRMPRDGIIALIEKRPGESLVATKDSDGSMRLHAVAPLTSADRDVYLLIGLPTAALFNAINRSLMLNLAWLTLLTGFAVAGVWFGIERLVLRRVRKLVDLSEQMAAGNFTARSRDQGGIPEIDQLSDAFDSMADGLEKHEIARSKVEQALKDSEIALAAIVESSDDAIMGQNLGGIVTSWNAGAERIFGYSAVEMVGSSIVRLIPPDLQQKESQVLDRIQRGERVGPFETTRVRKNGSPIDVSVTVSPIKDSTGRITGASKVARDITERKKAEIRIRHLNRVRAVLSDINQTIARVRDARLIFAEACRIAVEKGGFRMAWIGLLDSRTNRVDCVAQAGAADDYVEKLDIVTSDEPRGRGPSAEALRTGEHAVCNDIEHDPRMAPWREDALRLGYRASAAFPLIVECSNVGVFSLYSSEPGFFDADELRLLDDLALDISFALEVSWREEEHIRMEETLRGREASLVNAQRIAKMGNWELDIVRNELHWSDQVFEIFGIEKTKFGASYEAFLQCVHPLDRARMEAAQQAALADEARLDIEHRIVLPDGTVKVVHELGDVTRDPQGLPVHLAGTVLDITERQRAAEGIMQANQRLQALSTRMLEIQETERRQFAHELHDEIGQSLTAIKISLQSLCRTLNDGRAREKLEDIMELAGQTLSQVRSMSVDLRPSQLDDLGLEAALRWNLGRQAAAGGFEAHFQSVLPAGRLASMIETTGYRVCQEALTNVVKHAQARNVTIRAEIRSAELYISVEDDGRGFDVERGRQAATEGYSFGLLGMEERVALAGGRLRMHSVLMEGTRVEMWLPATPASAGKGR